MDRNQKTDRLHFTLIDSDHKLIQFRKHLHNNNIRRVAMDFECEFNLHSYGTKLCLVQVFDGNRFFIIDPFGVSREELAKTLETKSIVKFFFSASSDKMLVYRQYGILVRSVFDLALLVDALGFEEKGLDSVLQRMLGIEVKHKKRYQRYNWTLRPVREDALQYALSDVCHLFSLHERLLAAVKEENKIDELLVKFAQNDFDPDKKTVPPVFRSQGYSRMTGGQKDRFERLVAMREKLAERLNFPPHNVLPNEKIKLLAQDPQYLHSPLFGKGINRNILDLVKRKIREAGL